MVDSVAPSGGGFSGGGDIGSIGSSGLSSFDLGGIADNGGGPAPTGTGALGDAGLSPIGSSGLTAFGPPGGQSEAAKLDHYNDLVQQNWDQLEANRQSSEALSRSISEMGQQTTPPLSTMQPTAPPRFEPPPFPTFTPPPPPADPGPLPAPPAFTGQPLDPASLAPPAPTTPTFALPEAAGGPVPATPGIADLPAPIAAAPAEPAAPFTPFAMAPDALASPVIRPDIAAPAVDLDPFATVGEGGLGLSPVGAPALTAFGPVGPAPVAGAETGIPPAAAVPPALDGLTETAPAPDPALPPWTPFAGLPLAPVDALQGLPSAPVPAGQPSYLAGLIDAAGQGKALSFVWDRYQQAVQERDGAAFPSFSSVFNGMMNTNGEAAQAAIDGLTSDLDWFGKVANGSVSLNDPATGMPTDEAIARAFNLATLGITGGLVGTELRAGGTLLGAGPIRTVNPGPGAWRTVNESMSPRSAAYQEQISGRAGNQSYHVNGTKFDGFNGTELLDAKGPGYAWAVRDGQFRGTYRGADGLVEQARRQGRAANGVPITWHVAEPETATAIRNLFAREQIFDINIVHTPVNK